MLLSFDVKLVFQFGVTIWIWSFVPDLLLLLKFETSIPTWCCDSNSKFPFQLSIKTQFRNIVSELLLWFNSEASFSSCYYNKNLKLCFWFLVRIQTGSFAFDLKFKFSSNEKSEMKHRSQFLLPIQLESLSSTFY